MFTRAYAIRPRAPVCACLPPCSWSVEHLFLCAPGNSDCSAGEAGSAAPALVCAATLNTTICSPSTSGRWSVESGRELKQLLVCACIRERPCCVAVRAPCIHAVECECLTMCVLVRCGTPFLRAWGNADCSTGEASSAAPPKPEGQCPPDPPHGVHLLCLPLIHRPARTGSGAHGSRSLQCSPCSSPETPCWDTDNYKKANNAWSPQRWERNIRVNLHA